MLVVYRFDPERHLYVKDTHKVYERMPQARIACGEHGGLIYEDSAIVSAWVHAHDPGNYNEHTIAAARRAAHDGTRAQLDALLGPPEEVVPRAQ